MSEATRTLEEQLVADLADGMTREMVESLLTRAENPHFEEAGGADDWRHHIPEPIRAGWWELSEPIRVLLVRMADVLARH